MEERKGRNIMALISLSPVKNVFFPNFFSHVTVVSFFINVVVSYSPL